VANVITLFQDSLTNLVSRMGTERDKASSSYYPLPIIADDQVLNAYRGAWLPRKIVDIPAFDSVRAWRHWMAEGTEIEPPRRLVMSGALNACDDRQRTGQTGPLRAPRSDAPWQPPRPCSLGCRVSCQWSCVRRGWLLVRSEIAVAFFSASAA
jgi:hypothetical protein